MRDKIETLVIDDTRRTQAVPHRSASALTAWCRIHRAVAGDRLPEQPRGRCLHNEVGGRCAAPPRNVKRA